MTAATRLSIIAAVFAAFLAGLAASGYVCATACSVIATAVCVPRWRGRTGWGWLLLWLRRHRPITLADPRTVANDRAGGGVRFQDGVAVAAVQLLGKPHAASLFTGSTSTHTENAFDIRDLQPLMRQSLGLHVDSLSVVSTGARRRSTGDYPRVYDTLLGTPPYAGQRETWVIVRVAVLANIEALQCRSSIGTATLAVAQRISAAMRQQGVRAKVATATDIVELERRLGRSALHVGNRRWRCVRADGGWLTTYWYRPEGITSAALAQAWMLRVDGITQNITLFADGGVAATLTVRSAQPPTAPPSTLLQTLPGEQADAVVASLCGPLPQLRGVRRGLLTESVVVAVGPSGVLLGKVGAGNRLMLPLDDPGEFSRVHIAADDALAKRIVVRLAGTGERITVHTRNLERWASVRMPDVAVTDAAKPIAGTTVSVVDGTVTPTPRPNTVISVGERDVAYRGFASVLITQNGAGTVEVLAAGQSHTVEIELFRAENRYVSTEPVSLRSGDLEPVDVS
ncbi:type VII secretion protein EccE [Mycobacterium vicinigordonae]|uniref:Type VII secretion protein EccE n=1 Tax=Mycobacterium vicinigordonae TaxID=1719132 RepID=A0A7D6DXU7_9MYCO|nr:type VII secretion protein EccE [Mycobacterium vicinigordonae]QLL07444.1 type VII secretion protein EccE [Mycobacterium vicinigordonae]